MYLDFDYGWYVWCVVFQYAHTNWQELFFSQAAAHWQRESQQTRNDFRKMIMMGEEL
jgi:hypothetical protein